MSEKYDLPCIPPSVFGLHHLIRFSPQLKRDELERAEALDAFEILGLIDCIKLWICKDCLCVNGLWSYDPNLALVYENHAGSHHQVHHRLEKCSSAPDQEKIQHSESISELPVNRLVDLCWCCGQALIPTGSRWSTFFCPTCKQYVFELNEAAGSCLIPIGRHSIANGINGTPAPNESIEAFSESFAQETKTMNSRIDRLRAWRRMILHELIVATDLSRDKNISISAFGNALLSEGIKPEYAFIPMVKFVLGRISKEQLVIRMPYTGIFWPEFGFESLMEERGRGDENNSRN